MIYNLGKVAPNWCGNWNDEGDYTKLDCVFYDGSSYMCIKDVYSETPPPQQTDRWTLIAKGIKFADLTEAEKTNFINKVFALMGSSQGPSSISVQDSFNVGSYFNVNDTGEINLNGAINIADDGIISTENCNDVDYVLKHTQAVIKPQNNGKYNINADKLYISNIDQINQYGIYCYASELWFDETDLTNIYTLECNDKITTPKLVLGNTDFTENKMNNLISDVSTLKSKTAGIDYINDNVMIDLAVILDLKVEDSITTAEINANSLRAPKLSTETNFPEVEVRTVIDTVKDLNLICRTKGYETYLTGSVKRTVGLINILPGNEIFLTRVGGEEDAEVSILFNVSGMRTFDNGSSVYTGLFCKIMSATESMSYNGVNLELKIYSDNPNDTGKITIYIK